MYSTADPTDVRNERVVRMYAEQMIATAREQLKLTGRMIPLGLVVGEEHHTVVPFNSPAMTTEAREAWIADIRTATQKIGAVFAATLFKGTFKWAGDEERHEVVVVLVDHADHGYIPLVAEYNEATREVGDLKTMAEAAKASRGMRLGAVRNVTGRLGRLLPKHWMN